MVQHAFMSGAATFIILYSFFQRANHIQTAYSDTMKLKLFLVGIVTLTFMYGYITQLNNENMLVLLQS